MNAQSFQRRRQQGVTLIIVLILLLIVTVLGIGGARIAMLAERSTRYDRDFQVAMQAAEAALMDAEFDIRGPNPSTAARLATFAESNTLGFVPGCGDSGTSRGLCAESSDVVPVWRSVDFAGAKATPLGTFTGRAFDAGSAGVSPARRPSYIIEALPDTRPGLEIGGRGLIYRITAVGFGPREDVQVMLQTSFKKELQ
jgi:type IV pilus assembly protein PilX